MQDFNVVPKSGTFGIAIDKVNENFDLAKVALTELEFSTNASKGLFASADALNAAIPSPKRGDWALVGDGFPAELYVCDTDGTWTDSGNTYSGGSVDLTDYPTKEDLAEELEDYVKSETDGEDVFSISDDDGTKIIRIGVDYFKIGNRFFLSLQSASNGNILKYQNGVWIPSAGVNSINDLIATTPQSGDILKYSNGAWVTIQPSIDSDTSDTFKIVDEDGVVALEINGSGFKSGRYEFDLSDMQEGQSLVVRNGKLIIGNGEWAGKVMATYGDSIVAINNGDFVRPYAINDNTSWGVLAANYFGASKFYGRGIGGQNYKWGTNSGSVSWVDPNGNYINRLDVYSYDSWNALSTKTYPSGVTAQMISNGTAITTRGCGCSWKRITDMFPATIKDTIDVVAIQFHNDSASSYPDFEWVENSVVDPEWAESDYYDTYDGDYNIETTAGGIASTIMKLQAWMPNAKLVLCTPISGKGTQGQLNLGLLDNNTRGLACIVEEMANIMSIPIVDFYGNDGINGLNRTDFISDGIHPYTTAGKRALANAFIGGMKSISQNYK